MHRTGIPGTILTIAVLALIGCRNIPSSYQSFDAPLTRRSDTPSAGITAATGTDFHMYTGEYQISFLDGALLVTHVDAPAALALEPLSPNPSMLAFTDEVIRLDETERSGVALSGSSSWGDFAFRLWVYPYNPGLINYELELVPRPGLPAVQIRPEWVFVDPQSGEEIAADYEAYADRATNGAPSFYGYSAAMDSTLLYWLDLTRLNPFIEATRYSTAGTPVRRGRRFGHNLGVGDLQRLPPDQSWLLYDSYLYLSAGPPADETDLFRRYLQQVGSIYDLLARPPLEQLPDWQALATETFSALDDPDTWVVLDGRRYWRAYVADTRQSAEAITQLDVGAAVARYIDRYGESPRANAILQDSLATLVNFYNPGFGLMQNSGPLSVTGDQGRGDTWYELGHVLKAAELGVMGYEIGARLARDSRAAWTDFAHTVDYLFPKLYNFMTWQGMGREPDAAGGYALYMLRLADLGCGEPCLQEAKAAVQAFPGHGFAFAYETHMTAAAALAAAELAVRTGDDRWLDYAYGPIANLIRLSWVYEVDYGPAGSARTFFGLMPTQEAGVITPKEQYEAWIYLAEFLRLAHGRVDPDVEKLVAEFYHHSLLTLADSLPPRLPPGVATEHPAAYDTVPSNRLDLYIPLEDMGDGWDVWGAIGQEVYGAGMAPTFAALAYEEVAPGVTVYGGYPLISVQREGNRVLATWAGGVGYRPPVMAWGVAGVMVGNDKVPIEHCGQALCFSVEAGREYSLQLATDQ